MLSIEDAIRRRQMGPIPPAEGEMPDTSNRPLSINYDDSIVDVPTPPPTAIYSNVQDMTPPDVSNAPVNVPTPAPVRVASSMPLSIDRSVLDIPYPPMREPVAEDLSGLSAGSFSGSPKWGGVQTGAPGDPTVLTAGQLDTDAAAHGGIERRNAANMAAIAQEEKFRGDPMDRALSARKKEMEYEDLAPAGATSSVQASFGEGWGPGLQGTEIGSDATGEQEMGGPTNREDRLFQQALLKQRAINAGKTDQKEVSEAEGVSMRSQMVRELFKLRRDLDRDVAEGTLTPIQADKKYSDAEARMDKLAGMLKPGMAQLSAGDALAQQAAAAVAAKQAADEAAKRAPKRSWFGGGVDPGGM